MSPIWLPQRQESLGAHSSVPMRHVAPELSGLNNTHVYLTIFAGWEPAPRGWVLLPGARARLGARCQLTLLFR